MNKDQILKNLRQAKPDHIEWIKQGHKLVKGLPKEQIKKPVDCAVCNFGKWYQEEGFRLVNIPQLKSLEALHNDIHSTYTALYYITFDRRKKSRITLISGDLELPVDETPFRKQKLIELETKTVRMIRALSTIETKVNAMQDQDFENGWLI
jgi:predicted phosphoadenosine phosphosulfate sulfurtransferase